MLDAIAAGLKAALYVAVLSAAGLPLAAASLRASGDIARYATRLMRSASAAAISLSVMLSVLLMLRLGGAFDQATLAAVFISGSGASSMLQLTGATLLLLSFGDDAFAHGWRISGAAIITVSFAFGGHAPAMSATAGLIAFLHVTAASWWVGSLWLLLRACTTNDSQTASLITRFSSMALYVVGALIVAGAVLILALVDFEQSPWFTPYAQMLSLKLSIVIAAFTVALFNRLQLTPSVTRSEAAAVTALQLSIQVELGIIAVVLTATAVLTSYFSPHL